LRRRELERLIEQAQSLEEVQALETQIRQLEEEEEGGVDGGQ
jgi:hypothetical protein